MYANHRGVCLAHVAVVAALAAFAACDDPGIPESRIPASLQRVSGDAQTAVAGETLADSLRIRVLNRAGEPVPGIEVEFARGPGAGTLDPARSRTDASGVARAAWTLGPAAGAQTANARVVRGGLDPLAFSATALTGEPVRLVVVSGNDQAGIVGKALADPLVVRVVDAKGNGVPGVQVRWLCQHFYLCKFVPDSTRTDATGHAMSRWTLHWIAGTQSMPVQADGVGDPVHVSAVARPGPLTHLYPIPADPVNRRVHPACVRMEAFTMDDYANRVFTDTGFVWSTSNPAVAIVTPDPVPVYATVCTRGPGAASIDVRLPGVMDGLWPVPMNVLAVEGPFTVVNTGLSGDALNDDGDVARYLEGGNVSVWRDGRETMHWIAELDTARWHTVMAINGAGALVIREHFDNRSQLDFGKSWLVKGGAVLARFDGGAYDVNDREQVVGTSYLEIGSGSYHGFVWHEGRTVWLEDPAGGTYDTRAVAINNRGQVLVNTSPRPPCPPAGCLPSGAAYVWEAGNYTRLPGPRPDCLALTGVDINDAGHVLVHCFFGVGNGHYLWTGAAYTHLDGLVWVQGGSLNNRDEVVGWGYEGLQVWRDGHRTLVLRTHADYDAATINNHGQVLVRLWSVRGGWNGAHLLTPRP